MTTPSIADVKKAAERIDECLDKAFSEDVEPQTSDLETLLEFTLSVLNSPGLSAERLAEIQRKEQAATEGPWKSVRPNMDDDSYRDDERFWIAGPEHVPDTEEFQVIAETCGGLASSVRNPEFIADARQAVPELLAEVLRLRAGVTADGEESR